MRGAISLSIASHLPTMLASIQQQAREIAARPRQARDEARADRVGDVDEYDRDCAALPLQRGGDRRRLCEDHVGLQCDQLFRERLDLIQLGARKASVDADIAALRPSKPFEPCRNPGSHACMSGSSSATISTPMRRTRSVCCARAASGQRRRAAEQRDELAPPHSITSSTRASSAGGTSRPSALAVLRLTISSSWWPAGPAARLASRP